MGPDKFSSAGRIIVLAALSGVLAAALVVPVVAGVGILVRNTSDKVTAAALDANTLPQRSALYDSQGHLITYFYGVDLGPGMRFDGINRQPVSYGQISPVMLKAIVAIEDDRYWSHGAIDFTGTLRAAINDLEGKAIQGGSTIVQQYVKGVLVLSALGDQAAEQAAIAENLPRKISELRMAINVAHKMTKQQILDGYLNDAYFGSGAWGIEAAAETYFHTTAARLTLTQAATLAGIVENPSEYDPLVDPQASVTRRDTVLARMAQTGALPAAAAAKAEALPLAVHQGAAQNGCTAPSVGAYGFFCDFVVHTILLDKQFGATTADRARLLATGGLQIHTTASPQDQSAATNAVNYVLPYDSDHYNPGHNADTEVLMVPGSGQVTAIAEDRPYGTGSGQTVVDLAVNSAYGGLSGVQTGSSAKLFTLITALEQGLPFGYTQTVKYSQTVNGYTACDGAPAGYNPANKKAGSWSVVNASAGDQGTFTLYTGTTQSINTYFALLERKVGLCNVVKTAMNLGLTWADGTSLLRQDPVYAGSKIVGWLPAADHTPSFTLGSVSVSPMSMAAAYATVASGGIYCAPVVLTSVTDPAGKSLPVPSAGCHRVLSSDVANAVNYILRGVLVNGTAAGMQLSGYQAAGKTGTSNIGNGNGTPYAAFAGYTTNLVGYSSVFNPVSPTTDTMGGSRSCYRVESGGLSCPGEMFGANAPATTWHMTFDHADLGQARPFGTVPKSSPLWGKGNGTSASQKGQGGQGGGFPAGFFGAPGGGFFGGFPFIG